MFINEKEEIEKHVILRNILKSTNEVRYYSGRVAVLYDDMEDLLEYKTFFECEPYTWKTAEEKRTILYQAIMEFREIINNKNYITPTGDKAFEKYITKKCREVINDVYDRFTEWINPKRIEVEQLKLELS